MSAGERGGGGMGGPPGDAATRPPGFSIVVAMDRRRGIGYQGDLPWPKLKGDMKFFRELTTCPDRTAVEKRWGLKPTESADVQAWGDVAKMLKFAHPLPEASDEHRNAVVMGRKTWESLPENFRPLPDRFNGVLSRATVLERRERLGDRTWPFFDHALTYLFLGLHANDPIHDLPSPRPDVFSQVFVIGGGQIFSEALGSDACVFLYVTEIDAEFPGDTFFPETPDFRPVLSSPWIEEGGVRYRFRRYDRVSS